MRKILVIGTVGAVMLNQQETPSIDISSFNQTDDDKRIDAIFN